MSNCYLALGTLIIGIAIAQVEKIRIDFKFVCLTFIAKFIAWPLLIQIIIISDKYFFKFFNDTIYYILTILSVVPLATNIVTLASLLKIDPGKAASAVLLGVLFAALYIPIALKILL
jgi:hypothetical protein